MSHLTEEQFESILNGQTPPADHLQGCKACSDKLAEKKAIAARLQSAFSDVQASEELAVTLKTRLALRARHARSVPKQPHSNLVFRWQYWAATAAAIIMVPVILMLSVPSKAMAAKAEFVKIHNHNLDPDHTFFSESDPEKLAHYLKRNLGFDPLLPKTHQGLELRGCCVKHFRGKIIGSYVVHTPEGVMSIIVVTDSMKSLGMDDFFQRDGYRFGKTHFAKNDMVSTHIGNYTYCAVGEISHEYLTDLLVQLLSHAED
ncbi:MAG: anti-sigma factor family protein [Planctomycetota bacterium]|jgi:hypothetical protein